MTRLTCAARVVFVAATAVASAGLAPASSAAPSKLMGMLPAGYSSSNCQSKPVKPPTVEGVACNDPIPGGPGAAQFALYANTSDMNAKWESAGDKYDPASTCPGNQNSPGPWKYDSSGKNGGQVECGTMQSSSGKRFAVVNWTDNAKLRVGFIAGTDLSSLYKWWQSNAG